MNLISTSNLTLTKFTDPPPISYAILSHTWTEQERSDSRLTFCQTDSMIPSQRVGWSKVKAACGLAKKLGFSYIWIDIWSISKSNDKEISENVKTMYRYYAESALCIVYLEDVQFQPAISPILQLEKCKWFTRGWTLVELLAPVSVFFYDCKWEMIGTKLSLGNSIQTITGIPFDALSNRRALNEFSIAQRMSWASKRSTTLDEDMAYCLFGIFNVQMSVRYGEGGSKAFIRLQEEIIRHSNDQSVFAWTLDAKQDICISGLLAESPRAFLHCGDIVLDYTHFIKEPMIITNQGLRVQLKCTFSVDESRTFNAKNVDEMIGLLGCAHHGVPLGIKLKISSQGQCKRVHDYPDMLIKIAPQKVTNAWVRTLFVQIQPYHDQTALAWPYQTSLPGEPPEALQQCGDIIVNVTPQPGLYIIRHTNNPKKETSVDHNSLVQNSFLSIHKKFRRNGSTGRNHPLSVSPNAISQKQIRCSVNLSYASSKIFFIHTPQGDESIDHMLLLNNQPQDQVLVYQKHAKKDIQALFSVKIHGCIPSTSIWLDIGNGVSSESEWMPTGYQEEDFQESMLRQFLVTVNSKRDNISADHYMIEIDIKTGFNFNEPESKFLSTFKGVGFEPMEHREQLVFQYGLLRFFQKLFCLPSKPRIGPGKSENATPITGFDSSLQSITSLALGVLPEMDRLASEGHNVIVS